MLSSYNDTLAGFLTLLIVGSAALFGLSPTASADSHATEIGCTTIEEPGVYHLAADLSGGNGDCLVIQSWDVTIDGQGHTIANTGGHAIAAERETVENVTIRDLEVVDAGDRGIHFGRVDGDVTIHDVTVENANDIGIAFGPGVRGITVESERGSRTRRSTRFATD